MRVKFWSIQVFTPEAHIVVYFLSVLSYTADNSSANTADNRLQSNETGYYTARQPALL
jgi:hypothetical protein